MIKYYQSFCKSIGDNACYFLDLIRIAELYTGRDFDPFTCTVIAAAHKCIDFTWDNLADINNYFCEDPDQFLYLLTGVKWTHYALDATSYKAKKGEYVIRLHALPGKRTGHFNMEDFDSVQNSNNVKNGNIISFRIYKPLE